MPSSHKRAQDVEGEFDGGSNASEEHRRENKRSRMHSEADDYQPSSQFHSSPETLQLSTSIDQPSDPRIVEDNTFQHQIVFALDIISQVIAANNPESALSGPLPPTHMDQMPCISLPAAGCTTAELQRQLVQTWDVKRVQELEHQGECL
jgi:hypothetical protein